MYNIMMPRNRPVYVQLLMIITTVCMTMSDVTQYSLKHISSTFIGNFVHDMQMMMFPL